MKKERRKEDGRKEREKRKKVTKDQRLQRLERLKRLIAKLIKKSRLDPRLEKGLIQSSGTLTKFKYAL